MVDQDSEAPLAVVTGANTGLGFETAKGLIRQGFRVIVSAHPGLSRTALFDHGFASRAMVGSLFKLLMPLITQTAAEGARPTFSRQLPKRCVPGTISALPVSPRRAARPNAPISLLTRGTRPSPSGYGRYPAN